MNRRQVLQALSALPLAAYSSRLLAAPRGTGKFLLVFLRGGYDAANLLIPTSSTFYYESRPNIAIAQPGADAHAALALDSDWSLHPALQNSVYPLFQNRQAAFIPFAGTDDLTRSHFETQDSIELGQPINANRNYQSGFLNRLAGLLHDGSAISFTDQLPLVFRGNTLIPNMALGQLNKSGLDSRQTKIIAGMYQDNMLAKPVMEGFDVRDEVIREVTAGMDAASSIGITAKGFELEARRIATLMKDKYSLGFVDVGGWDTHVGEGGSSGYLANRFDELGRGLAAYATEMGSHWRNTVVVVISEFGRTFRENGNRGTDHGHGTVYWVLGGNIRGGRIAGDQIKVNRANLFQDRDFPVLNDYRAILGGLLGRLYDLSPAQIDTVFPGVKGMDLGLV
ncbi:MAG: DUF1501 domain-containing protein [Formivibrio sp.]|nr:DUF1501 domain-containing protein [Formivibrio sp.]